MAKNLKELRSSPYHQQLGRKMFAAFVAQQQGIALNTAFKNTTGEIGDLWLVIADYADQVVSRTMDINFPSDRSQQTSGRIV